jgi:hypothetical protein
MRSLLPKPLDCLSETYDIRIFGLFIAPPHTPAISPD